MKRWVKTEIFLHFITGFNIQDFLTETNRDNQPVSADYYKVNVFESLLYDLTDITTPVVYFQSNIT